MYKCYECGHLFEDGEQAKWTEDYGEKMSGCPVCGGGYEEVKECILCGLYNCTDEEYCVECKKETLKKFQKILEDFSEEELQILRYEEAGEMI